MPLFDQYLLPAVLVQWRLIFSFFGACCPLCPSCLVCWYVVLLTCDGTVGVVCCGFFVVSFLFWCKIWHTLIISAHGLNFSSGRLWKGLVVGQLLLTLRVFLFRLVWSLNEDFVWFSTRTLLYWQLNLQKKSFWKHHWYLLVLWIVVADVVLSSSS